MGYGSNLPPGCRESDIPGNKPEDGKWDAIIDWFLAECEKRGFYPEDGELAIKLGLAAITVAQDEFKERLKDGLAEERMVWEMEQHNEVEAQ